LGTGATAAIVGGIGAAGSIASGVIGSNAAGHAADTQAQAANNAALLQKQAADQALAFSKQQYGNSLNIMAPWLNTGQSAIQRLSALMGLRPNQGLPPGVINPNAPAASPNQIGGGGFVRQGTGPNGTAGDAVLPLAAGAAGGPSIAQRFSAMDAQPNSAQVPMTGSPGQNFGPSQFTGDPNDPTGQFNPGGTGGLGVNPATGTPGAGTSGGFQNPDANNFGTFGSPTTASTNQGSTGQVARTDGGGDPNAPQSGDPSDFGSLAQGFNEQFQSPTDVTEQNDPGYQFRLKQGQEALQNSAAARGGLLSGGTAKALSDYNQNSASAEYGNVYNRAYNNFTTRYNIFKQNQNDLFNRYATLSGIGQTSAGQLSNAGLTTAGQVGNILQNSATNIGQQYNNAAAANASGYVGSANAINGAIGSGTNTLSSLALLLAQRGNG
jgi:hypothetical protein